MRTAIAEDLPQASPAIVALSGFIMVCLVLLVLEVGLMARSHADTMPQPMKTHTAWRSLTL
jgi:hypothetical protein